MDDDPNIDLAIWVAGFVWAAYPEVYAEALRVRSEMEARQQ